MEEFQEKIFGGIPRVNLRAISDEILREIHAGISLSLEQILEQFLEKSS